jgi:hypothetical protein
MQYNIESTPISLKGGIIHHRIKQLRSLNIESMLKPKFSYDLGDHQLFSSYDLELDLYLCSKADNAVFTLTLLIRVTSLAMGVWELICGTISFPTIDSKITVHTYIINIDIWLRDT